MRDIWGSGFSKGILAGSLDYGLFEHFLGNVKLNKDEHISRTRALLAAYCKVCILRIMHFLR